MGQATHQVEIGGTMVMYSIEWTTPESKLDIYREFHAAVESERKWFAESGGAAVDCAEIRGKK